MQINYKVVITDPKTHMVKVVLSAQKKQTQKNCRFFLPAWSPGSYLMREYARHIRQIKVLNQGGESLFFEQLDKGTWQIDWERSAENSKSDLFTIEYEVYCHELTVRTSHITAEHAYLHGPSYLLGFLDLPMDNLTIEFNFPPYWQKISTGLSDISRERSHFIYQAANFDQLLDCPVEIGNQQTDGFMVDGVPHELAFFGRTWPHRNQMKEHIKTIVEYISSFMGEIPYDRYLFLAHFAPKLYGGLEHANSTALQFDGQKLAHRADYVNWLALVAHEYFHTWNVKRIRPVELGPFNYRQEAYTTMLWLAEGLTSLMDELFVYQCGVVTLQEYLELQKKNLNRYYATPGRRFHSLEESSFNAWIKLYRPDENSSNSSVSYYLKGGIVFWCLNVLLVEQGHSMQELLTLLWKRYKDNPAQGIDKAEFFSLLEKLAGEQIADEFATMIETTEELDLTGYFKRAGLKINWERAEGSYLGINVERRGDNLFIKNVELDGPAYKSGLNAQDEIVAINGQRIYYADFAHLKERMLTDVTYRFTISRLGGLQEIEVVADVAPLKVKSIEVEELQRVERFLSTSFKNHL